MQSLISGAECATTSNPLSQVLKHTEGDRSLQRDRVDGPSSSRLRHLPPSAAGPANAAEVAIARQFFDTPLSQPGLPTFQGPLHLAPHQLLGELQHTSRPVGSHTPDVDPSLWPRSINLPFSAAQTKTKWSDEFRQVPVGHAAPEMSRFNEAHSPMNYSNDYSRVNPTLFQPSFISPPQASLTMNWDQEFSRRDTKGKGKAIDFDFESAFNHAAASIHKQEAQIVEVNDGEETLEAAFERTKLTNDPDDSEYLSDFQKVWDGLRNSGLPPPDDDIAKWEAEYNQVMESRRDDLDFGHDIEDAWQSGLGNLNEDSQPIEPAKFDDAGVPILEPYKFEPNNPHVLEGSNLARAKELLDQNGSLTEAALLLEAAIQQGELGEGGYEAWILLGETRSMDEREEAAMRALTEGVRRAQEAGDNGAGMLSLAISYTNESFDRASHTILHRWLVTRFPSLVPEQLQVPLPISPWASHDRLTDAFLTVARQQHLQGDMDPEVQIGLGVLFYTNAEFDKAKDCFESALASRPKDYLLWNRLGSCLSNGSKPEEALGVYREALQLRPTYTRAIYNVGVACLNIGAYKEAAEHFLSALSMQESAGGDKSEQLWQTLRKCFVSMDRDDLADAAKPGQSLDRFRQEGFEY
ncbi:TPR-like protein [Ramaria rubella]|nr:TPR-like protein [Ramaria rubella]